MRLLLALLMFAMAPQAEGLASAGAGPVTVELDRAEVTTVRSGQFEIRARVVNHASTRTYPMIAHLNVASRTGAVSVDPEDWSSGQRLVAPIEPGGGASLSWELRAGDIGVFDLYVVLLPDTEAAGGGAALVASPPTRVTAAGQHTVSAADTLPVVLAFPVLLGLLLAGTAWRRRRVR